MAEGLPYLLRWGGSGIWILGRSKRKHFFQKSDTEDKDQPREGEEGVETWGQGILESERKGYDLR